jgi:hypothetical protein
VPVPSNAVLHEALAGLKRLLVRNSKVRVADRAQSDRVRTPIYSKVTAELTAGVAGSGGQDTHNKACDVVALGSGAGELISRCHETAENSGGGSTRAHGESR